MKIRGHHLICRLGFRGLGYDERFTETMKEVLRTFELNPELNLKVVANSDILCAACPNRKEESCYDEEDKNQDERIKEMDRHVIKTLRLDEDKIYTLKDINHRIADYFTNESLEELCQVCEWKNHGYCKEGLDEVKQIF